MKASSALLAVGVLLVAAVCVRLGFWQIARYHLKHRINAETRAAMAAPPLDGTAALPPLDQARGRRIRLRGRFDEQHQILLSGRPHETAPGVEVVTPLLPLAGDTAVLVNRGWLYAADAVTALPQQLPVPGVREVVGLAQPIEPARGFGTLRPLLRDTVELWTTRALDRDSLRRVLSYPVAPYLVRLLPSPGAAAHPLATTPEPQNEMMHASYAVQWFLFAAIALIGPLALAASRRRRAAAPDAANPDLSFRDRPDSSQGELR